MFEFYLFGVKFSFVWSIFILCYIHSIIQPSIKELRIILLYLGTLICLTLLSWLTIFCYACLGAILIIDECTEEDYNKVDDSNDARS